MDEQEKKLYSRNASVKKAVRERTVGYIVAAFSLVAGLAWNDAVKALIETLFPLQENTLPAKFIYAGLITVVAVVFTIYLTRLFHEEE